jgi:RNA-directed DNA polymerase
MPISLLGKMSSDLLLPKDMLDYLISSAPHRYKVYQVPKRSGTGMRTIAQPAKEVKKLQYWVINNIFPGLLIHPSAMAYVSGKNIADNSGQHTDKPYLLKLDFRDFFPSIKADDFLHYSQDNRNLALSESDIQRLIRILFWCPKGSKVLQLSIGAPSSPFLSNAIMYRFDSSISLYCSERAVTYTRYADDVAFSMHDRKTRADIYQQVQNILASLPFPSLQLNTRKTIFASKAHRRMLTGLILSNDGAVSLGREKKRRIRAQIHHFICGRLSAQEISRLRGMLSFARDIEPTFVIRMENKYGKDIVKTI